MSRMTVVRQNRCDTEMRFLLFVCYFFYFALIVLGLGSESSEFTNKFCMMLYMIFVPGLIFMTGYQYAWKVRTETEENARKWMLFSAVRYYVYFILLTFAYGLVSQAAVLEKGQERELILRLLSELFSMTLTTPVSAVFFTMALIFLAVWGLHKNIQKILHNKKLFLGTVGILLLLALLRTDKDAYMITASLFGSEKQPAVAGVPYFAFFLIGAVFEEKKPGFQWKLTLGAAAVSGAALILYVTPLQDIGRVAFSFLPVYLVYVAAELLTEVTVRFPWALWGCRLAEPAFGIYAFFVFCLSVMQGLSGGGLKKQLLAAALLILAVYAVFLAFWLFCKCYGALENWVRTKVRHRTAAYFLIYTVVFSFVLFLVFFDFIYRGKTFIVKGDGISQYYPNVIYFVRYIRELFQGIISGNFQLPMYDFSIGLGAEITYSLEPLYFLHALFDEEHMELAYNLVTVLRFYLAGISCSVLCLYFKKDYFPTFLATVVYVVSGFALYGGAMHTMFVIPMIMLPLMIVAIEEILRHRRWYLCTIFVAVSLLGNYYFLYMNTIAMGIYFLVRFFCQKDRQEKTFQKFIGRGLVISGSYLLGVAMSCIVLVTKFGMYLGSGRGAAKMIKTASLFFYRQDWLADCFLTFLTMPNSPGEWLRLGYLPIALIAVIVLFSRKGRKEMKIFSVCCLVFMAFPLFGFIFSGFSSVINRWCYMISLTVAFIVADCYQDMLQLTRRERLTVIVVTVIYGYMAFFGEIKSTGFTEIAFVTLVATFIVLLVIQNENRRFSGVVKKSLMFFLTLVLVFYSGMSIYELGGRVTGYADPGQSARNELDTPLAAVEELEDDSFYRSASLDLAYYTSNAPMLLDYNSITMICSTLNGNMMEYLENMGAISYSITQMLGLNNRGFMSALAAVKYYGHYGKATRPIPYGYEEALTKEVNGKKAHIYENQYALPLGYTYDSAISEEELESYDVLERQEVMMQQVVMDERDIPETVRKTSAEVTTKKLEITGVNEKGAVLEEHALIAGEGDEGTKKAGNYRVQLQFEAEPDSELYVVLHNAYLEGDMSEKPISMTLKTKGCKQSYSFKSDDYRYHTGQKDFVFNLGYHKDARKSLSIILKREGVIHFDSLEVYCQPMGNTEKYTSALTQNVMENVSLDTNKVSGTISLDSDKILVLSIPYQRGWTAYVDGEKTELKRANYMYMALPLGEGEHTIELEFAIPGIRQALIIMPASGVLFLVLCVITAVRGRRKKKKI